MNGEIPPGILADEEEVMYKNGIKYLKTKNGTWRPEKSLQNLKKPHDSESSKAIPKEVRQIISKKANEAKRQRKRVRDDLNYILSLPTKEREEVIELNSINNYSDLLKKDLNQQTLIVQALLMKAQKGDVKAIELIYRILGEIAPEETKINIVNEAQGAINSVLDQLEKRNEEIEDYEEVEGNEEPIDEEKEGE